MLLDKIVTLARFLLALAAVLVSLVVIGDAMGRPAAPVDVHLPYGNVSAVRPGVRPLHMEDLGLGPFTLAIVVAGDCADCQSAAATYRRIVNTCSRVTGFSAYALVMGKIREIHQSPWIREMGTGVRSFPTFNTLEVQWLPLAFGLDQRGTVVGVWPGPPTDSDVDQILAACEGGRNEK